MAIDLHENFQVQTPIDAVWSLLMSPQMLADCMPGASITELIGDRQFEGTVKLRVGAISVEYAGIVTYTEVDANSYTLVMSAEASETGGGSVTGTIITRLQALAPDNTDAWVDASFNLTGRLVQVARGMINGVAARIIDQFLTNVRTKLEAQTTGSSVTTESTPPGSETEDSINILAVIWAVITNSIKGFISRLSRRSP